MIKRRNTSRRRDQYRGRWGGEKGREDVRRRREAEQLDVLIESMYDPSNDDELFQMIQDDPDYQTMLDLLCENDQDSQVWLVPFHDNQKSNNIDEENNNQTANSDEQWMLDTRTFSLAEEKVEENQAGTE